MTQIQRGRGSRRVVCLCAIAALGLALSGCGGSAASTAASPAAQSSAPAPSASPAAQSPAPAPSASPAATGPAPASSPPTGSTGATPVSSSPPTASVSNVTLNWTPPTQNTDGTPLTNLAGYDIHYGTSSRNYTRSITVNNPGIATYVVSNLSPGTYYFSVAALNTDGTESPLSAEVSTTVN
jgi:hypothetical protein